MVLLDINNTAGESFKEALDKEFGRENTLFLKCDVESEGQVKGNAHSQSQRHLAKSKNVLHVGFREQLQNPFPVFKGP